MQKPSIYEFLDAAQRIKDEMDLHAIAQAHGYAVFNLRTGRPVTRDVYPSRRDARRFAERYTRDALLILEVQPDGMPLNEAEAVLNYERALYSRGFRTPDSLESEENSGLLSMPRNAWDRRRMARQLTSGKPLVPDGIAYGNLPFMKPVKRGN